MIHHITHLQRALCAFVMRPLCIAQLLLMPLLMIAQPPRAFAQGTSLETWAIHDKERPQPPVVDTGTGFQMPAAPPADAVVLFDGMDLSAWQQSADGSAARWKVDNGYFEVVPGTGGIQTVAGFGDVQLHLERASPNPPQGEGQDSGNSGVFLMGRYEVQILNSFENTTYPDGQAAAIYGQYPPLVNATRLPGEWQSYDIIFRAPRFDASGALTSPATVTVLHNGVLVQNHVPLTGPSGHYSRPPYAQHADKLPLALQDHDHPVRFRNIWLRELWSARTLVYASVSLPSLPPRSLSSE